MNSNTPESKRRLIMMISAVDVVLSAAVLLILFGVIPIDISGLDIPRPAVDVIAGLWFLSSLGILVYMVTKTDSSE